MKYKSIYDTIVFNKNNNVKMLVILIDPDKINLEEVSFLSSKINLSPATHIFIGGSIVNNNNNIDALVLEIKKYCKQPILIFPGDASQITNFADGILFLNLISGRNPDYLIEIQVNAVPKLLNSNLEIISTGYILLESGSITAVERITKTKPLSQSDANYILQTAHAGIMLGNKMIYLEAGSGAKNTVSLEIIKLLSQKISTPLIVGGGIRSINEINNAFEAGADLVVIGTAFENDSTFFE